MSGLTTGEEQVGRRPVRRRVREEEPRRNRVRFWYTDGEMEVVRLAAERDNQAPAAWAADMALAVAKDLLVPVSANSREVLEELIRARGELARIGNNWNQIALQLNAGGTVTAEQLAAVAARVEAAVGRVDAATLQVMRERRPRS